MESESDSFNTLAKVAPEVLFKEKKSKFLGQAFPVNSEAEIKTVLEEIKAKHPQSNHVCYAWQLGVNTLNHRVNDDGEPNNSAGKPIYGQIQSFDLTNVLVTVTRYFGGTKLGVGGLIAAYRNAAKLALDAATIETRRLEENLLLYFPYSEMSNVMRIIKQHALKVSNQKMEADCQIELRIPKNDVKRILQIFQTLHKVRIVEN